MESHNVVGIGVEVEKGSNKMTINFFDTIPPKGQQEKNIPFQKLCIESDSFGFMLQSLYKIGCAIQKETEVQLGLSGFENDNDEDSEDYE